jgi:hypothetical protein
MHAAGGALEEAVGDLPSLTLEELDERSALRRRVDTKYVVPVEFLVETVPACPTPAALPPGRPARDRR